MYNKDYIEACIIYSVWNSKNESNTKKFQTLQTI